MMTISREAGGPQAAESVRAVVRSAEQELHQLLEQRAQIMKRIGAVKQTLAGLANLFGDWVLDDELLAKLDRKPLVPRSGFTRACRLVLMNAATPLGARQICDELLKKFPEACSRHKNLYASVTTVLARLVDYSEAQTFLQRDGHRVWQWIADEKSGSAFEQNAGADGEVGVSPLTLEY